MFQLIYSTERQGNKYVYVELKTYSNHTMNKTYVRICLFS